MSTLIDCSTFQKTGDMTGGGGLAAIFDGNLGTSGYATAVSGWCAVNLAACTVIDLVQLVSQANGFDASGATAQITLSVRGKNGAAPTSKTDGTLLASLGPFTDTNAQLTKDLNIANPVAWDWLIIVVSSTGYAGAYSALAEAKLWAQTPPPPPPPTYDPGEPELTVESTFIRQHTMDVGFLLPKLEVEIPESRINIGLDQPAVALFDFFCDVEHNGSSTGYSGVLGFGFWLYKRSAALFADLANAAPSPVLNTKEGENILSLTDHYGCGKFSGAIDLEAGYHQFFVKGASYSTASNLDGLAKIYLDGNGKGLNRLRIACFKGAKLYNS